MKNVGLIILGVLAWLFYSRKGLILGSDTKTDSAKDSELRKEKVKEVVKVPNKNNLGMKLPKLNYLEDPILKYRTNRPFDTVSSKITEQTIQPKVVKQTFSRTSSGFIKEASRDQVKQIFSRTIGIKPVPTQPNVAPVSFGIKKTGFSLW